MNQFWKNRPVLVTGASGFVGAHIARALLDRGAEVFCLQRRPDLPGALTHLRLTHGVAPVNQDNQDNQGNGGNRLRVISGAIEDRPQLQLALDKYGIDSVFHLAAQSIVGIAALSPVDTFEANIRGTYLLLDACRHASTVRRIIVASSEKAYGAPRELPCTEQHPLLGLSPYDASKACADLVSRAFAHACQLPVAVVRSTNVYGPADLNLSRIIPGTINSLLHEEAPVIRGDGTPIREFIHVDDVARGYLLLAEMIDQTRGEAFNLGSGQSTSIIDLVNLLIRIAGHEDRLRPAVLHPPSGASKADILTLSTEKIRQLNLPQPLTLEQGLPLTFEWYRRNLSLLPAHSRRH